MGICPYCNKDGFAVTDNDELYWERCWYKCKEEIIVEKREPPKNFVCRYCGSIYGKILDEETEIFIQCINCGKTKKICEKKPEVDLLSPEQAEKLHRNMEKAAEFRKLEKEAKCNDEPVRCPKCSSTQITTGA